MRLSRHIQTAEQSMFQALSEQKKAEPSLSQRLQSIYETHFGKLIPPNSDEKLRCPKPDFNSRGSGKLWQRAKIVENTIESIIESDEVDSESDEGVKDREKIPSQVTQSSVKTYLQINQSLAHGGASANILMTHHDYKPINEVSPVLVKAAHKEGIKSVVRPDSVNFLVGLFGFFARCPYQLDSVLTQVFRSAIDLVFNAPYLTFQGFSDNGKIESTVLSQVCNSVHLSLLNANIKEPLQMHTISVINSPASLVLRRLIEKLEQLRQNPSVDLESIKCFLCLYSHLETRKKQGILKELLGLTIEPPTVIKSLLNPQAIVSAKLYNSLAVINSLITEERCQSSTVKRERQRLLSDSQIQKLIKLCYYACSLLTRSSSKSKAEIDFQKVFNLYFKMLLKLIAIRDEAMLDARLDTAQSAVNDDEDNQLSVIELTAYIIKQCYDREAPLITQGQLSSLLGELINYVNHEVINPMRPPATHVKQRNEIFEAMETLCMFCGRARLQNLNPQLFEKLCEPVAIQSLTVNDTRDSSNSLHKMEHFFNNLRDSSIFEDAILQLIQMEVEAVKDSNKFDQTASYKLISEITQYLHTLVASEPCVPEIVNFTTAALKSMLKTTMSANDSVLKTNFQSHIMLLMQKLFQGSKCFKDVSPAHYKAVFQTMLNLLMSQVEANHLNFDEQTDFFASMLEEFTKLFRRKSLNNSFLIDITEIVFGLFNDEYKQKQLDNQQALLEEGTKQVNHAQDIYVSIILSLIEMRQSLLKNLIKAMVERFQETQTHKAMELNDHDFTRILKAVNTCVKTIARDTLEIKNLLRPDTAQSQSGYQQLIKADLRQNTETVLQGFSDDMKHFFLQLWMLIAVQGYSQSIDDAKRQQLAELAALTPTIDYNQDFQLSVRNNPQKEEFSTFAQSVEDFFKDICSKESFKEIKETFNEGYNQTKTKLFMQNPHPSPQKAEQSELKKETAKHDVQGEQSEDEQVVNRAVRLQAEEFGIGETVFLALYALINCMSLFSDKSTQMLRYSKECSLIQTIITLYSNEKISQLAQPPSMPSPVGTTLCTLGLRVDSLSKSLFNLQMQMYSEATKGVAEELVQHDFVILLKAACNDQQKVRQHAMEFLVQISNNFPGLLYKKRVLYTILDILSALSDQFDDIYDSMSHPITLAISCEQIMLDPSSAVRMKIQADLLSLLSSMFLKAIVLAEQELYQVFDMYTADLNKSLKNFNKQHFGLYYFNQLRSQVDIQKFYTTYNPQFQNFHQIRLLAIKEPAKFSKVIDLMIPVAFSMNSVLDITRQQSLNKLDELARVRPFFTPQAIQSRPLQLEAATTSIPKGEMSHLMTSLVTQALKAIMKIDLAMHLHFTVGLVDRKRQLDQVIETHWYLALRQGDDQSQASQIKESIQKRSAKFLAQDYSSILQKQSQRLLGVFKKLIGLLTSCRNDDQRLKMLRMHAISLMSTIPFLALTKETVESYCLLVRQLTSTAKTADFEAALLDMLPFTTQILLSRLQVGKTKEQKVGGKHSESKKLKLIDRVKETINQHSTEKLVTEAELSALERSHDFNFLAAEKDDLLALNKIKLHSSHLQDINAQQVIQCLLTFIDILKDEMLFRIIKTSSIRHTSSIVHAFNNLLNCASLVQPAHPQYAQLCLSLIRLGHMIISIIVASDHRTEIKSTNDKTKKETATKAYNSGSVFTQLLADLSSRLQLFSLKFFRQYDRCDFKKQQYSELVATVQLIEDIKYLSKLNELSLPNSESSAVLYKDDHGISVQAKDVIVQFVLSQLKQKVLAWNYQENMQPNDVQVISHTWTRQQANQFVLRFPKFALKLISMTQASASGVNTFGSLLFKQLEQSLVEIIKQQPLTFMHLPDALDIYIRTTITETSKATLLQQCAFWKIKSFLKLLKYLTFKFYQQEAVNQLALKPLEYADPKTVIFYLPQLFQSLRYDVSGRLKAFFNHKSRVSASFAHHLLWFCKVESVHEEQKGRKVPLPLPETLNKTATEMYDSLMSERHMSQLQSAFFKTETEFFEKITSISGLLKPAMSKDEKKARIKEKLVEYNQDIPQCVYLPTNQTYRVVGIVTSSGMPMQSAARVPIWVSFEVEDYPGPDHDPILQRQDLLATLIQNTELRIKNEGGNLAQIFREWTSMQPKSRPNISIQSKFMNFNSPAKDESPVRNYMRFGQASSPRHLRLNSLTSEMPPVPLEEFANLRRPSNQILDQINSYQLRPRIKSMFDQHDNREHQELQDKLVEEHNERQQHKDFILKSYFQQPISKRENEMLSLAIKYVENLQEVKRDGITASAVNSNVRKMSKLRSQVNIAAQREIQVPSTKVISCIFKANDDLRQDILALQVIKLFQKIFKQCDLELYVCPYNCISNRTGEQQWLGGIIEVIPNSYSRDQLGKAFELDLYKYFLKRYGSEHSEEFRFARLNFVKSLAAYCVVSYILQIKDRHNGNIMIDDSGHLIHIDFGFIFDWSPGKDMRFERSNFKLTQEFVDIMGGYRSESFNLFVTKVVQGFLAVRRYSEEFVNLTELMHYSGFPCFKPPSLSNLEWRFRKDLDDFNAALYIKGLIEHARTTWTTAIYDWAQYKQNKIVF